MQLSRLLDLVEEHTELKEIAESTRACNFEEFMKGLKWLSKATICMGCRADGGWPDCPIRKCCVARNVAFCYECPDFPCQTLEQYPLF